MIAILGYTFIYSKTDVRLKYYKTSDHCYTWHIIGPHAETIHDCLFFFSFVTMETAEFFWTYSFEQFFVPIMGILWYSECSKTIALCIKKKSIWLSSILLPVDRDLTSWDVVKTQLWHLYSRTRTDVNVMDVLIEWLQAERIEQSISVYKNYTVLKKDLCLLKLEFPFKYKIDRHYTVLAIKRCCTHFCT